MIQSLKALAAFFRGPKFDFLTSLQIKTSFFYMEENSSLQRPLITCLRTSVGSQSEAAPCLTHSKNIKIIPHRETR